MQNKKRKKRSIKALLLSAAMMVSMSAGVAGVSAKTVKDPSGDWVRAKNGKWWYQYSDGTWPVDSWLLTNGKWYHFDKSGWMQTGWVKDGNDWYYLNANGSMRTGWVKTGENWYYLNKSGRMRTGWLEYNGNWYFLGLSGAMKTGDIKVKGNRYRMGEDGALLLDLTAQQRSEAPLAESGFRMLQTIYETEDVHNKNVLISPVSADIALGLAITGADKDSTTQKELIAALMPGSGVTPEDYNAAMEALSDRMTSAKKGVSWNVANSVWAKNGGNVQFRESYIDAVKEIYAAEDFEEPFNAETVQKINNWVKENTRDRIPQIIDSIDNTEIFLINALAFDGSWSNPVTDQAVKEEDFTNADGTTSKVNMMYTHESKAILLDGGVGFIRSYQGGEYSFVAILPPEGKTAEEYLEQLVYTDGETFTHAFLNPDTERGVDCRIPEFKVEYGVTLNDTLKAMGINDAFDDNKASFGAMITDDSSPVVIDKVIQKTMIQLDRNGTQAAAATAIAMKCNAVIRPGIEPYKVYLDRPFVYGIVDNTSGVPIFLGVQNCMPGE